MGLRKHSYFTVAILVVALTACNERESAVAVKQAKAEVLLAAKDYTQLMKSGDPGKAYDSYWDVEELVKTIFGDELDGYSRETREEVRQGFRQLLQKFSSLPELQDKLRGATFDHFEVEGPKAGRYTASFVAHAGSKNIPNLLVFKRINEKWRIVDCAPDGPSHPLLGDRFRRFYEEDRSKVTPLQFITELVQHFDQNLDIAATKTLPNGGPGR